MKDAPSVQTFIVRERDCGSRIDTLLASLCPDLSRSYVQTLISEGHITLDGLKVKPSYRVSVGQVAEISYVQPTVTSIDSQDIPLDVVYEDDDFLAVNKPAGLVVHPAPGHQSGTLVNAVLSHIPDIKGIGDKLRPGIVHRLDKNTSGLIVIAKNQTSHARISKQFADRIVRKYYVALVHGQIDLDEAIIDGPIGRHPNDRKKMATVLTGREALTRYRVVQRYKAHSLLEALPTTGRTHQIRVHLASMGFPIVGDTTYGRSQIDFDRHFLHAKTLEFKHPSTEEVVKLTAKLSNELEDFLEMISHTKIPD